MSGRAGVNRQHHHKPPPPSKSGPAPSTRLTSVRQPRNPKVARDVNQKQQADDYVDPELTTICEDDYVSDADSETDVASLTRYADKLTIASDMETQSSLTPTTSASTSAASSHPTSQAASSSASAKSSKQKKELLEEDKRRRPCDVILQKFGVKETSDVKDSLQAIFKMACQADAVFNRNRSVTKEDKQEILDVQRGIMQAVSHIEERLDAEIMTAAAFVNVVRPKSTSVMCQTDDLPGSDVCKTSDVVHVVREELAKFREEMKPSMTSYASVAASSKTPVVKIVTPKSNPAIVISSSDVTHSSHKDVLNAWRKDVSFKDTRFAPAKVQTVQLQSSRRV